MTKDEPRSHMNSYFEVEGFQGKSGG